MPRPNLTELKEAIAAFDTGPLDFSVPEAKALRKEIYHAMYYDDQGWQKMNISDHIGLARALMRIKSIEPELYDPTVGMYRCP